MSSQFHDECSAAPGRFFIDSRGESASARRNLVFGPTTLTTGWSPIVLVTTPPQPASNARTMFDSDSVGGADDSRNGFWNLMPVNVVDRSVPMVLPGSAKPFPSSVYPAARRSAPCSADRTSYGRLDQPERLVGRHEDLVRVVEPERPEIDQQVMAIRHRQRDVVDLGTRLEGRLGHCIQRMLHRTAVVGGKRIDERRANPIAGGKAGATGALAPGGGDGRRENALFRLRQRSEEHTSELQSLRHLV